MNLIKRLNKALDYIEANLLGDISTDDVAREANVSVYHFNGMFFILTDISLKEYIRRRRLSLAAYDLQMGDKVIDVAYKYGYGTPDAFSRAFVNLHGVNPSAAKKSNVRLKSYPKMSFQIQIKGDVEMNYKITKKDAFTMYGIERIISKVEGENYQTIPQFWQDVMNDGSFEKLRKSTNVVTSIEDPGIANVNAVMCYGKENADSFPYLIAAFETKDSKSEGFAKVEIGSYTWAIFRTEDHKPNETVEKIQELWRRVFSEWLPSSNYTIIDGPNLELYGRTSRDAEYSEVWLPVEVAK